jgi:hypothetical protein
VPLLRDNHDDFLALVAATARDISYPEGWVEKDYWITEILRSLSEPFADFLVVFKGGTNLSKAWRLIQRMSQDVDILLVPPQGAGSNARDTGLKAITQRAVDAVKMEPALVTSSTGIHRATNLKYSPAFLDPVVPPGVLLEMGVRGGPDPNERMHVQSFIAEYALAKGGATIDEFDELRTVEISCLRPERTLVEKLSALHQLATKCVGGEQIKIGTSMRHYYDIAMLLGNNEILDRIQQGSVAAIATDVDARSAAAGWAYTARPPGGYADSPAFSRAFLSREDASKAYSAALELVIGGPRPTLDAVIERVRTVAGLL